MSVFILSGGFSRLLSLAIIFLVGLSAAAIFERIGLPRFIGMLGVGIVVSPYVLDLLDPKKIGISAQGRYADFKVYSFTISLSKKPL